MTFQGFELLQTELHNEIVGLTSTKGREYANSGDRLANFKVLAADVGVKPEVICYTYLMKHMRSIAQFVKSGQVQSTEPIHGRIVDAILYLELLDAIISEEVPF